MDFRKQIDGRAFFAFSRTKEGEHPTAVLEALGVQGIRLVDDGGSEYYDAVAELGLTRGRCWCHQRRYFFNAAVQHEDAKHGLRTIHDLFEIERQVADLSDADRLAVRKARSAPLVDGFYTRGGGGGCQGAAHVTAVGAADVIRRSSRFATS